MLATPLGDTQPAGPDAGAAAVTDPADPDRKGLTAEQLLTEIEVQVRAWPPPDPGRPDPSEPRDWTTLSGKCKAVLTGCRHLQAAVYLTVCEVERRTATDRKDGLDGLVDGLALIAELVEKMWAAVHPGPASVERQLIRRRSTLRVLAGGMVAADDPDAFLGRLLRVPLCPGASAANFLDVSVACLGRPPVTWAPDAKKAVDDARVRLASLVASSPADVEACKAKLASCLDSLTRIEKTYQRENVDPDRVPQLKPLRELLERAAESLTGAIPAAGSAGGAGAGGSPGTCGASGQGGGGSGGGAPTVAMVGGQIDWKSYEFGSIAEVRLALQRAIEYLERANEANPAPMFVQAGLAVIGKNYEWLLDTVPVPTLEVLKSVRDKDKPKTTDAPA